MGPGFGDAIASRLIGALMIVAVCLICLGGSIGFIVGWLAPHAGAR